ncbi:MAG: hypothetical protein KKA64_00220 [Nanoarchaeota archaeon]|nr:hypothetical protein [Nanoarchaeota archaeon]
MKIQKLEIFVLPKQEVLEETGSLWKIRNFPSHSKPLVLKILPFKLTAEQSSAVPQILRVRGKRDLK